VCGVELVVSGQKPVAGSCEHGDEPSGSGTTELVTYSPSYPTFPNTPLLECRGREPVLR
jgi:hypothetical protein